MPEVAGLIEDKVFQYREASSPCCAYIMLSDEVIISVKNKRNIMEYLGRKIVVSVIKIIDKIVSPKLYVNCKTLLC